eukprot:PLAT8270.1.p1 GENE.PLAT8270.1~~PLAT8270.1.p1  ORF type:complete len:409 (-),score=221.35 PLAT8270.1:90-1295(-)
MGKSGKDSKDARPMTGVRIVLYTTVWYSLSALGVSLSKAVVKQHGAQSSTVTVIHLGLAAICDVLAMHAGRKPARASAGSGSTAAVDGGSGGSGERSPAAGERGGAAAGSGGDVDLLTWLRSLVTWSEVQAVMPVTMAMVAGKMFAYLSYGRVPVSLVHTVKAASPIVNVVVGYCAYKQTFHPFIIATLFPIAFGVTLASASELSFDMIGFLFALSSAVVIVFQNLYMKKLLQTTDLSTMKLHFYNAFSGTLLTLPLSLYAEMTSPSGVMPAAAAAAGNPAAAGALAATAAVAAKPFPWVLTIVSGLAQYGSSLAAYMVLSSVLPLTYTIMGVMKRVFIIVSSIWYFANPVNGTNVAGIIIALAGVFGYNYLKQSLGSKASSNAAAAAAATEMTTKPKTPV